MTTDTTLCVICHEAPKAEGTDFCTTCLHFDELRELNRQFAADQAELERIEYHTATLE
jgi:hypothetical protein